MIKLTDFEVIHYPDGHKHIKSNMDLHGQCTLFASIKSFDDLFLIAQIKAIHPELKYLDIQYLLAARCDRRFSPGEALDLDIVCKYISQLGFQAVTVLDPHSTDILDNYGFRSSSYTQELIEMFSKDNKFYHTILPDKGARRALERSCADNNFSFSSHYTECQKTRLNDKVVVTIPSPLKKYDNYLIVDDLCDGGATFINIADQIHEQYPDSKVYLVVTHAIFSKGIDIFQGKIEKIYCTDSFAKFNHPLVQQIEVF